MIKRRSLLTLILLSLITFGIYGIIFWYGFANDVNRICEGDGKNTKNFIVVILLSIITCGIYYFIWVYGVGNRLAENGPRYGITITENGTTVLLWHLIGNLICGIGTFVAYNVLIKNINALGERYNNNYNMQ